MGRYKAGLIENALVGVTFSDGRVQVDRAIVSAPAAEAAAAIAEAEQLVHQENQPIPALAAYVEAIRAEPDHGGAYHGLGWVLAVLGKSERAEAAFLTSIDHRGERAETLRELGNLDWKAGQRSDAVAWWRRSTAIDDSEAPARLSLALAAYYEEDWDRAIVHLDEAEQLGAEAPTQLREWIERGRRNEPFEHARVEPETGAGANVGPQVRVDVGGGTFAANETSIAAVQVADGEIVASWNDWRLSPNVSNEVINTGAAISIDGGATWTDGLLRPPPPNQSAVEGDPMTAYDQRTGNLWVGGISFANNGGLYVARKAPGSPVFEPSVQIGQSSFADKCYMAAGPAPGDPNSTVVYIAYNEGLWRSFDLGETWSFVNAGWPFGIGYLPRVAADGTLQVAYWDLFNGMKIFRSTNAGNSFSSPVTAAVRMDTWGTQDGSRFPGSFRVPAFGTMAIHPLTGNLFYIYPDTTNVVGGNSNVDLYMTVSSDEGDSWSSPTIINDDSSPPGDQLFPWIEIDDSGRIHMVFHDSRNVVQDDKQFGDPDGFFDVYYSYSDDGGRSWSEARLTPNTFNSKNDGLDRTLQFLGDYSGISFAGDVAFPLYLSTQNGDSDSFIHRIERVGGGGMTLADPSPGLAGIENTFSVSGATPGAAVAFLFSRDEGSTEVPGCAPLEIGLDGASVVGSSTADANGNASVSVVIPPGASGTTIFFQSVDRSACVASNLVGYDFP